MASSLVNCVASLGNQRARQGKASSICVCVVLFFVFFYFFYFFIFLFFYFFGLATTSKRYRTSYKAASRRHPKYQQPGLRIAFLQLQLQLQLDGMGCRTA